MPAEIAEPAPLVESEGAQEQAQPPSSEGAEQTSLKFSIGDVMKKVGVPVSVQEAIKTKASPPVEEKPVVEEPEEEEPPTDVAPADEKESEGEEEQEEEEPESEDETKGRLTLEKLLSKEKKLLKRIDKVTAQKKSIESERDQLATMYEQVKGQLDQSQPVVVAPSVNDPLANVSHESQLDQLTPFFKNQRDWARKNSDGLILHEGTDKERVVTKEEMADYLSQAEDMLNEYIPQKREWLNGSNYFTSEAKKVYPNLFDRSHRDSQAAKTVLASLPGLAQARERFMFIGDYLDGYNRRIAKQNGNGTNGSTEHNDLDERITAPKPPIAEHTPSPPTRREAPNSKKKLEEARERVIKSGGDQRALTGLVKEILSKDASPSRKALVQV